MSLASGVSRFLLKIFGSRNERILRSLWPTVHQVSALEPEVMKLSDERLEAKTEEFRDRLARGETLDDLLAEAFAAVRESARRNLRVGFCARCGTPAKKGRCEGCGADSPGIPMRHFDVQILGGIVLHQGKIAEMVTGEGKTLVATLPAYLNALEGKGVHIVTVNDYLARRDRAWMAPVFEALGLTVGAIQSHMESRERQPEYACDITYGTNNEFGFDYLRDNMKIDLRDQVQQRGLHYAIVDEVDSILVDEARTPLIISGPAEESTDKYYTANRVAKRMSRGRDYDVKEKEHAVILTEDGIERAERIVGVDSFYTGQNMEWPHHIEQALRAHELYKRDVDYVVREDEVIIVDEFTGRLMEGRVWSEGLHQAVAAKEGLRIKEENQTLATITFQNYFKLYGKLAGMTGTAMTEAVEFYKIYRLDVVAIPTNKPLRRHTFPDCVYGTAKEKYHAIVREIEEVNKIGRPILVGTVSIEKSELLSGMLERRGIPHDVLNAKHHEREAEIVAKAGRMGHVTIATNMAGRGTDIILGTFQRADLLEHWVEKGLAPKDLARNLSDGELERRLLDYWAEYYLDDDTRKKVGGGDPSAIRAALGKEWAPLGLPDLTLTTQVNELGGLHIVGTERHEARRIDNQLRGRTGRQGDPGTSRFYLSLEDDLMRVFASERVQAIMKRLGLTEGQEISSPMVTRAIQRAQKKVEGRNFEIRKNLLEYDGVMNEQRKLVYSERQKVLEGRELTAMIHSMMEEVVRARVDEYLHREVEPPPRRADEDEGEPGGETEGEDEGERRREAPEVFGPEDLVTFFRATYGLELGPEVVDPEDDEGTAERIISAYKERYAEKTAEVGDDVMPRVEAFILLSVIDRKWKDHLHAMDQLRAGIGLRGYAQVDPKVAYKKEGYEMFEEMIDSLRSDVTELVLKVQFRQEDEAALAKRWAATGFQHDEVAAFRAMQRQQQQAVAESEAQGKMEPIRNVKDKVGRNAPCPCGSGKKYKRCCGRGAA